MVRLKVYYNPNADYAHGTADRAPVQVSIDGRPVVDNLTAHKVLFKNIQDRTTLDERGQTALDIFNDYGLSYKTNDGTECINNIKSINYKTITPDELKQILTDRFSKVRQCCIVPVTEIECIQKNGPATGQWWLH